MLLLRRLSRFIQHLYLRQYLLVHYLCGGVATNAVTMPRSQGESQSQATGMRMAHNVRSILSLIICEHFEHIPILVSA